MARTIVVLLLIIIALFLIFEMTDKYSDARETGNLSQVLQNQKLILEKLQAIDKKLDVIKMRIRQ